ncbi:A-kinase anchor protein 9 isoform X2 [Marmota monax]|uniref:A-kinase anchor protein 9 isoform X2 n=1 Tax=Marmota monax TaxID=9995 RepID=UPI0026EAFA24|nr:A-kinase anchor protein 9 isoform X2 [Marmota monax]
MLINSSQGVGSAVMPESTIMRTLNNEEMLKHEQVFSFDPESEISTTADDYTSEKPAEATEDEERRRKIEIGRALVGEPGTAGPELAEFRQRRARLDGQNPHKKPKKKKTSSSKNDVHGLNIDQPKSEEMLINSSQGVGSAVMPESTIMRTLNNEEMLKHEQVFSFDPESEISTTADDYTSEKPAEATEDEERRRKIEIGRALVGEPGTAGPELAEFRQRRARLDGQNPHKKPKKKKTSSSKNDVHGLNIDQPKSEEMLINSSQGVGSAVMPESTIMRTLNNEEMLKHEQVFSFDPESEISTTADDYTSEKPAEATEDEERRRKIEIGRALVGEPGTAGPELAEFRQRRARLDGQNPHKKPKKKKTSSSKNDVHGLNIDQPKSEEMLINSSQGVGSAVMPESTIMRTLNNEEMLKHEQVFSFDPESEISTTADDYTSEKPAEATEDEERRRKIEIGRALVGEPGTAGPELAEFRQRRARLDGQNPHKKPKKKKTSSSKNDVHGLNIDQPKSEEMLINSSQGVGSAVMPESTIMRTLNNEEMLKHEQVFSFDPESEISTTADDYTSEKPAEATEDEERRRKIEIGRALLAEFRQRRARLDGQNPHKKPKKKKTSSSKNDVHGLNIDQPKSEEMLINSSQGVGSAVMPESTIMRTLNNEEMLKHEQVFSFDPESEISTTADDYTSEVNDCCNVVKTGKPTNLLMEEEFGVVDSYSEQGAHYSETRLELIENESVGKPEHEPEELNRELEEMRATYGTEGLHQLQASETLRNSTHSNTAADLLQAKQQILTHQQQLEEKDHLLEDYQKKKEDFKMQINFLQEKIKVYEMEQDEVEKSNKKELQEKETIIQALNIRIIEEKKNLELKDQVTATEKLMRELQEQIASMKLELANSKHKEKQFSEEIKQFMGTVEDLQKRHHYTDSQFESDVQRMVEQEMQKRLEQLQAKMDEMYGQQIVQMKQELIKQHMSQIEELKAQRKEEIESVLKSHLNITINEDQIKLMNVAINELNMKLQDTNAQKEKLQEELGIVSGEKSTLQRRLDDLFEELNFLRDQIQRARMIIAEQESQLNEAHKSLSIVEALKAEIVLASESRKELELKHEAEVTNNKLKLEMLEKEKNAVLDRMAESQEAELERLRTQLLFSHEEELSKLKEDLEVEHRINIEKLKDSLGIHYKQQIYGLQNEMSQKIETMQFEKDNLITKQNQLVLEISKLKDLQKSTMDSKSEEMTLQMHELQEEIEILRQEKKEKGTLEQEVQELQLKIELLEKEIKEKEDDLKEKFSQLEAENNILKNEKKAIEDMLKIYVPAEQEEKMIFIDSSKSISKDCSWQKEMEMLTKENEALKQQCIQLNEEIEKQRSTFSFAEKNFEVNYQELQEEYTCLLKVKDDLEDSKNKQELEYKSKLKALNEELHLQRINPATIKVKSAMLDTDKAFVAEPLEICEVVEKDTTELMENLEVTKREKLELSEKMSDLSEQLKQKHGEVDFLSEEVKSLKQEKEKILLRCQELELLINHHRAENINMCDVHLSSLQDGIVTIISKDSQGSLSNVGEDFGEESKTVVEEKISFENVAIRRESKQEQLFSPSVTNECSPGTDQSSENDKLHQELYVLKSEQEQAIDRERERDLFQQEIQKLEQQLKVVPRIQPVGEHQTREVEQLTNDLKEKTDKCSELLLSKEQLQRDVQERNEEIERLEFRVRELEQALLVSTDNFQKVEDQKQFGALQAKAELSLEVQLQAERDAIDRKEKEITNLEEQLEQFRDELENKNEEVQQLHMQLEIQKKESTTCLQELEQENKLFKDEMEKLRFAIKDPEAISTHDQHMLFGKFAQIIQEKEVEIDRLNEQIRDFHQQLRLTTDNKDFEEKNELIRDLEAQIECRKSGQERLKKNREEETDKLNEVIEKLQEQLSYIEQNMLVDTSSPSEQEDSLKHQLEKVIAEKLALEQQVEITNEEMAFTKNILKETNFQMDQLTQELVNLKREHDHKEKIQSVPDESVSMTIDDLSKDQPELEVIHIEDVLKPPENKMYLRSFEESTKVSRNLETKLLQLESSVSAKDLELIQCYKQIEDIKEQGQSETEMLQKKIVNLQKVLEEKVAAALVSQVQLEAVQEYEKFYQDKGVASSELEKENMQNLNQITENKMESDMSALTLRISDLERQVIEMHTTLISEKEQVETAEKNALEKEKKLIELQKLLEDSEKKIEGKERKRSPHGDFVLKTATELINARGESGFFEELEALKIELVATKEELATFKERTEKLQKELLVKETNMASLQRDLSQVKNQLGEEKKKLSHFLIKEDKSEVLTNRNICLEPLPVEVGKNTASQTDQILKVNMSNQTPQILVKNAGIQIDVQTSCSSEKVSEIIRQFTEIIERIQELHAAEILDMESRHISETQTLKREHYVAVELLTEECGTLKAVIQCLRSFKEGSLIPEITYSNAYQTRGIYSSDSGSDWSQGVYLTQNQGFDTASEGRGEEGENLTQSFPKKIKGLLRAVYNECMQVLSLTESPCGNREDHSIQQVSEFWLKERRAYLNIISSLKELITKIQVQRESEVCDNSQSHESLPDWRGEFLLALQHVFLKEHNVLLAAFQTELTALGTKDAVGLLKCLEQRIQEQGIEYRAAMEYLQKIDRRSLLSEIEVLRAQINDKKMTLKREQENDKPNLELLEYTMQQKQSQILEMQVELSNMKDKASELQEHLSSEKMVVAELKNEIAQTELELETTLKAQHKHLKELEAFRLAVKDETDELRLLNDILASEQKKSRELQWALEKEKAKLGRSEERDKEQLEPTLVLPGTSGCSLTERLLRQNTELTGHISQLTEEKNNLRNVVVKMEEQLRRCQQTGTGGDYSSRFLFCGDANLEAIIASEEEIWIMEKSALQKTLKKTEAEVYKLKAELRNDTLLQNLNSDSENTSLKRTYGQYLRAESFRKPLIYHKKYLLQLLGEFQECEDATITLLAWMRGQPAFTNLEFISRPKGLARFRSAVRASIAISRMKILVQRWQQVTDSSSTNVNRDGFELNPGAEKTDPFYHSSGELELDGEPRHTTYRSRSDLDSPRCLLPFQNRSPGTLADLNPGSTACSHLQNYDPDRALADYITRLEALQRRLGTVQTGSTTTFHSGMRR